MQTGKESFRRAMLLIAFGVILFAAVTHLQDLWMGFMGLIGLFSPILLAGAFALILNVPVRGFERIFARLDRRNHLKPGTRNMLSLTLTLLLLPLVLAVVGRFILPQFFSAINAVVTLIRDNTDQIERFAMELGLDPKIVSQKLSEVSQWISQNLGSLAGTAVTTIASVFSSLASIVMSLILAIYLLGNKARVKRQCAALLTAFAPKRVSDACVRVGQMFIGTFSIFLSRQCLEACILGSILFVGMLIFGLPYAISLSCLTAVLALIPFIGAYMSFFIGFTMIVMMDPTKAVIFAIWFLLAQQVEGNVIYPHIVGSSVGLPAYVTLSGVFLGGAVAGIPGMVLIIPVISVIYQLLKEAVEHRTAAPDAVKTPPVS